MKTNYFEFAFKLVTFILCLSYVISIAQILGIWITLIFMFASSITLDGIDVITNALINYFKDKEG